MSGKRGIYQPIYGTHLRNDNTVQFIFYNSKSIFFSKYYVFLNTFQAGQSHFLHVFYKQSLKIDIRLNNKPFLDGPKNRMRHLDPNAMYIFLRLQ